MISLKFTYDNTWGCFCEPFKGIENEKIISNYLMDIKYIGSIYEKLSSSELTNSDIGSEVWGGEIVGDNVEIYSLFEPENVQVRLSKKTMFFILSKWLRFTEKDHMDGDEEIVEI